MPIIKYTKENTKQPKTFGELSGAEKYTLMLAYHEGKAIESYSKGDSVWFPRPEPSWLEEVAYRVKPVKPGPKTFGELSPPERAALTVAYHNGRTVQTYLPASDDWMDLDRNLSWDKGAVYRVKPEETKEPKTFGELSEAEQGALLLAHHKGETIQFYSKAFSTWCTPTQPSWLEDFPYRIKPEPVVSKEDLGVLVIPKTPEETVCLRVSGEYTDDVLDVNSVKVEVVPDVPQ